MRLTVLSDYSLRVLMYLAARPDRVSTIEEIASAYAISENHLMKVVHGLGKSGFVETMRGRGGGLRLARPADKIKVGAVLRLVEDDQALAECFSDNDGCKITDVCRLKRILARALQAYNDELDRWTLADLVARPKVLLDALADRRN